MRPSASYLLSYPLSCLSSSVTPLRLLCDSSFFSYICNMLVSYSNTFRTFITCAFLITAFSQLQARNSKGPDWLSDAVFYEIYPSTFQDSNGDGIGDIQGIISRLDYVKSLGVNAIWLNPTYTSAWMDGGYDIIDYYSTDPRFGTNSDLIQLLDEAHKRDIKVCLDLVAGHTSDKCPWFIQSKSAKDERYSDYYIWIDELSPEEQVLYDSGQSNFVRCDSPRGKYYLKNFYDCQPALNYGYANPDPFKSWQQPTDAPGPQAVLRELKNIMSFWLDKGFDGFRVDMAASLIKEDPSRDAVKALWRNIRAWMDTDYPRCALIAEWSNPLNSVPAGFHIDFILPWANTHSACLFRPVGYFGSTQACWFDRSGKGNPAPFLEMFSKYYDCTHGKAWFSIPTSNHDQLRPAIPERCSPDELKIMMTFFLTLPGVPYIYYGDEFGLRYSPSLPDKEGSGPDRAGSRTPMQWDCSANCGFSSAPDSLLYLPIGPVDGGSLTVASQEKDPQSLLNFTRNLIALRKSSLALSNDGGWELLSDPQQAYPMVYRRFAPDGESYIIALNPSGAKVWTSLVTSTAKPAVQVGKVALSTRGCRMGGCSALVVRVCP